MFPTSPPALATAIHSLFFWKGVRLREVQRFSLTPALSRWAREPEATREYSPWGDDQQRGVPRDFFGSESISLLNALYRGWSDPHEKMDTFSPKSEHLKPSRSCLSFLLPTHCGCAIHMTNLMRLKFRSALVCAMVSTLILGSSSCFGRSVTSWFSSQITSSSSIPSLDLAVDEKTPQVKGTWSAQLSTGPTNKAIWCTMTIHEGLKQRPFGAERPLKEVEFLIDSKDSFTGTFELTTSAGTLNLVG